MELFSAEFFSALFAIVVIDLVLAGDNAIVIALAARNVPTELRTRAIVWGTVGAIAVRSAMTMVVVWLLNIPGLMLVGGLALIWIAVKLLTDKSDGAHNVTAAQSFWGAMRTIVVADAVMGLDNVLAVAGAAHGSFLLVLTGLLISIPIVIWGSQIILKWIGRFPAIIYIGGTVLAWTAGRMIVHEPLISSALGPYPWAGWLVYALCIGGVLGAGLVLNGKERSPSRNAPAVRKAGAEKSAILIPAQGGHDMRRILIPVDGSANALRAVRHAISRHVHEGSVEIHLLHVCTPLSRDMARFLKHGELPAYRRAQAERALQEARKLLEGFNARYVCHVRPGRKAEVINDVAGQIGAERIVMGTARKNSLTRLVEASATNQVIERAQVPVELIAGDGVSPLERYGIPAALGATIALVLAAVD